jgi:hypothetical protein
MHRQLPDINVFTVSEAIAIQLNQIEQIRSQVDTETYLALQRKAVRLNKPLLNLQGHHGDEVWRGDDILASLPARYQGLVFIH